MQHWLEKLAPRLFGLPLSLALSLYAQFLFTYPRFLHSAGGTFCVFPRKNH